MTSSEINNQRRPPLASIIHPAATRHLFLLPPPLPPPFIIQRRLSFIHLLRSHRLIIWWQSQFSTPIRTVRFLIRYTSIDSQLKWWWTNGTEYINCGLIRSISTQPSRLLNKLNLAGGRGDIWKFPEAPWSLEDATALAAPPGDVGRKHSFKLWRIGCNSFKGFFYFSLSLSLSLFLKISFVFCYPRMPPRILFLRWKRGGKTVWVCLVCLGMIRDV